MKIRKWLYQGIALLWLIAHVSCDLVMSAVSANLATAMDSTLNEASSFTKVSSNLTSSQATEKFSFITVGPTLAANNIKILTSASLLRLSISSPKANSNAFVLKAGFKYFQSASGGVTGKSIYTLQEGTGITMTATSTAVISTGANAQAAADVLSTNLVLCATPAVVWLVDVVAAGETLTAALLQTTAAVLTVDQFLKLIANNLS